MTLFCPIRKIKVKDTPEERVRQEVLYWLKEKGKYPEGLIAVESGLNRSLSLSLPKDQKLNQKLKRRSDILVFSPEVFPTLRPLLLVECKGFPCGNDAFCQLIGYNVHLGAPLISLASPEGFFTAYLSGASRWEIAPHFPSYEEALHLISKN